MQADFGNLTQSVGVWVLVQTEQEAVFAGGDSPGDEMLLIS